MNLEQKLNGFTANKVISIEAIGRWECWMKSLGEKTTELLYPKQEVQKFSYLGGSHRWEIVSREVAVMVKNLPANAGDVRNMSLIPGLERYPGEGNGNILQFVDRGA